MSDFPQLRRWNGLQHASAYLTEPRVIYWTTSCLDARAEAISKEIFDLAQAFDAKLVFSISPHLGRSIQVRRRLIGLNPRYFWLARIIAPLLRRTVDINHVYAETFPWHYMKCLGGSRIVLTIASEKGDLQTELWNWSSRIVVQTTHMRSRLLRAGCPEHQIRLIYPGIDLEAFGLKPRSSLVSRRILFASFPRTSAELGERGVSFLLNAAEEMPEWEFTIVGRPWLTASDSFQAVARTIEERKLRNVVLLRPEVTNMSALFQEHAFSIIPFTTSEGGKECPRSLIESLACGAPALVAAPAACADLVRSNNCGKIFPLSSSGLRIAIADAVDEYSTLSANAVDCARSLFAFNSTYAAYSAVYKELLD